MTYSHRWNQRLYTLWAPLYDVLMTFHPAHLWRKRLFELGEASTAKRILLVGIGTGSDLECLPTSAETVGVDLSPSMLHRARQKATQQSLNFQAIQCDATHLPFRNNCFDLVVMTLLVSVVPNPTECLREALRLLTDNGRLLVLDKFLPPGKQPSLVRRILNLITRPFGTDINRRWEDMIAGLNLHACIDEQVAMNGSLRLIVVKRGLRP